MKGKYQRSTLLSGTEAKDSDSFLWKQIIALWPSLMQNVTHVLESGRNTLFWKDNWLNSDQSLLQRCPSNASLADQFETTSSFVIELGGWDLARIQSLLPSDMFLWIRVMSASLAKDSADGVAWQGNKDGSFSVKSSYWSRCDLPTSSPCSIWKRIWDWQRPQRIKIHVGSGP